MRRLTATAAACLAMSALGIGTASADDVVFVGFSLTNRNSLKCLNVAGGSTADGASVIQYGCGAYPNEMLVPESVAIGVVTLRFVHSGKCLDISGAGNNAGAVQNTCSRSSSQFWAFDKDVAGFHLRNLNTNKCLDVLAMGTGDEVPVVQWDCVLAHPSQDWIPS